MQAAAYLKKKGYRILEANFRCRFGEIDLIARDGAYLVFIEVKYRSSLKDGDSLEAVNRRKQRKIIRVAEYYLCMHQEKADQIGDRQNDLIHPAFHLCSRIIRLQQIVDRQVVDREKQAHAEDRYK